MLSQSAQQNLLDEHLDLVTEYMRSHRLRGFSRARYQQALTANPVLMNELIRQSPVRVIGAYDKVVDVLGPMGFKYPELGELVEKGFAPSTWRDFKDDTAGCRVTAKVLAKYPVSNLANMNPASFLKLALMDKELRDTPHTVLLRKLDETIDFYKANGLNTVGAVISRLRYPRMFHVGRAEIDAHLKGMEACFGRHGFKRASYLKTVFNPQAPYPRVFTVGAAEIAASANHLSKKLQRFGFTKAAWASAITQHPQLVLRTPDDLDERMQILIRRLAKHGVSKDDSLTLFAKNPKLFARDPSSVIERAEALQRHFGAQGLTVQHVVHGMQVFPALIRTQTEKLVDNLSGMAAYLQAEGVDTAPYFKAVCSNLSLAMAAAERQQDNHRLITASYAEGLLPVAPHNKDADPRVLALAYSATLAHSGEDIALRRLWSRLCGDDRHTHTAFFKTKRTVIEQDLRSQFGAQADMHALVEEELQGLESRLGVTFSALTHGTLASAKRTAPLRTRAPKKTAEKKPA